jgi:methionyl-tRNA formyltransferase
VAAVVTQPLRSGHKGDAPATSPIRELAQQHVSAILYPEDVNTPAAHEAISAFRPELLVIADYGQILARETIGLAPHGAINLHGSLLPKYRGAAPINWALYHGETRTGVTVFQLTPGVDAGPCLAQAAVEINSEETAVELEERLAQLGAPLMLKAVDAIERGQVEAVAQDPGEVSKARRLRKSDGAIDWARSAQQIKNQIRALEPWPRTFTYWHRSSGAPLRVIPHQVRVIAESPPDAAPGQVLRAQDDQLVIRAGEGALALESLQPAGKRTLSTAEFLRGYPVRGGEHFGPESAAD